MTLSWKFPCRSARGPGGELPMYGSGESMYNATISSGGKPLPVILMGVPGLPDVTLSVMAGCSEAAAAGALKTRPPGRTAAAMQATATRPPTQLRRLIQRVTGVVLKPQRVEGAFV